MKKIKQPNAVFKCHFGKFVVCFARTKKNVYIFFIRHLYFRNVYNYLLFYNLNEQRERESYSRIIEVDIKF